ncbi:helix-turn-helix domain-containing protein [Burkholderia contaminans]|uniref:helix-turn-helix domain-containing protein n=1 Tax=Burkholderia contaminans TaxID=488447 RepID=UPI00158D8C13|nr:helix-turn-helix domain-containing protein [Burkholderia contaminans]
MGSKFGETIESIMELAYSLHKQGIKPTQTRIAKELGLTKQAVSISLINHNKLEEFNNLKYSKEQVILNFLKKVDTSAMSIPEIWKLPIIGMHDLSYSNFSLLLNKHNIPHRDEALSRIKAMDTSQLTAKEIAEQLGICEDHVRRLAKDNNIPYKRQRIAYGAFDTLKSIDTSQYTAKELHELIGKPTSLDSLRSHISVNGLPVKNEMLTKKDSSSILEKLRSIDTTKYTLEELASLVGYPSTSKSFYHFLSRYNMKAMGKIEKRKSKTS